MEKKPLTPVIAGLILGLISVVAFLAFYFAGRSFERDAISYLPMLLVVGLLIFFIIKYSNDKENNVTFGNCFGYGFKATAVMAIVVFVCSLIFVLAQPAYKEEFMNFMAEEMNKNPDVTDEQRETTMNAMDKFFMISILGGGLFMNLLIGAIASLIGAAVAKKNPRPANPF